MSEQPLVVLMTAATIDEAAAIGRTIVDERLAACANLLPAIRSIYRWQDTVQDDAETLVVIKTTAAQLPALTSRIQALHSYDTPEVIALPIVGGSESYLGWLIANTGPEAVA
jgi:periplasmic divalent cation tolerance protein